MRAIVESALLAGLLFAGAVAAAEPARGQKLYEIARRKMNGNRSTVFYADPQPVPSDRVIVFEVSSIGPAGVLTRWRCIAVDDVAECLGRPVEVRYLPTDEKIVLTATLHRAEDIAPNIAGVPKPPAGG